MNILTLFAAFVPWIAFSLMAGAPIGNPALALVLAFIIAIALTLLTAFKQILQGYILSVVSIAFFVIFFVLIVGLNQFYLANYLSVLSMLVLTLVCWGGILFRFPFTLQYSREGVEPERAKSALFIRANYVITAVWAVAFTLGFAIDEFILLNPNSGLAFWDNLKWVFMIIAIVFTVWYPAYIHKERAMNMLLKYQPAFMRKE